MAEREREIISRSDAERQVQEIETSFFGTLEKFGGIVVEAGKKDGSGEPFTEERVKKIRTTINEASWAILRDIYEIAEDLPA